jgi:hypothetical protein
LEFHMDYSLCPNYHHHSQVKFREDPHDDEWIDDNRKSYFFYEV